MKLFYSHASPYARKCRMTLYLCGLDKSTELILTNPLDNETYRETNPLGKVPALVDGSATLFDSPLICEYLANKNDDAPNLFCRKDGRYFDVQKVHAQADGILDAAVSIVMEMRRETEHSKYWLDRWNKAIKTAVETLDLNTIGDAQNVHIGTLTVATALGYLDFRLPQISWRDWNEALKNWFDLVQAEPWFAQTKPQ